MLSKFLAPGILALSTFAAGLIVLPTPDAHAQAPRIVPGGNGAAQVIFPGGSRNKCIVSYDRRGRMTGQTPWCSANHRAQAARAIASYRREQGIGGPVKGHSRPAAPSGPPQIIMGRNGQGEVIFKANNCVVYYRRNGTRQRHLPTCRSGQVSRADRAMASYRREQGIGEPVKGHSRPAAPSAPPQIIMGRNGQGEVIFKANNCVVYYRRNGTRQRYLPACRPGQVSQADKAMASYRREQGLNRRSAQQPKSAKERFARWREKIKDSQRRRFKDRRVTVVNKGDSISIRRRKVDRNAGAAQFIESLRYRARDRRFHNRFRDGISVYARPPRGVRLRPEHYIVNLSRGSYRSYLDLFLAQPLYTLKRRYSFDEIVSDPSIRASVRSVRLNTLTFDFNSAEIHAEDSRKLEILARAMLEVIHRRSHYTFLLEGHTDAVGPFDANLKLSEERAASVQIVLVEEFGVPAENLRAVGYGKQYLEIETDGPEERNRRVVVRGIGPLLARR